MKDVSKALVFSDLHGRTKACAALLKAIERERPGLVIGLGDFLYNGPRNGVPGDYEPMECAKMLNGIGERKLFVRGNCDSRVDEMVDRAFRAAVRPLPRGRSLLRWARPLEDRPLHVRA